MILLKNDNDENKNKVKVKSFLLKNNKQMLLWVIKISLLAFSFSLLLSMFSEIVLSNSSIVIAFILLFIFTFLNVFSDMVGLAITSCQVEDLKQSKVNDNIKSKCMLLIKNSDKVSSILCDVVGDICGILCGVSGTMIAMVITNHLHMQSFSVLVVSIFSGLIAGLTVLFKAISKNYAVKNSVKILVRASKFLVVIKNPFSYFKRHLKNKKNC